MVGTTNSIIGFDRKIHLSWLDATAEWTAQGLTAAEVRTQLERLLEGQVAGGGPHNARGKTITVLLHIWVAVPDALVPFRDEGLALLRGRSGRDRLPVHWGMCLATYPFFREVAATTGRLLALQGTAALSQIVRRMTESWGERSTLTRAVQRVVRSFVEWGILVETDDRGSFSPAAKIAVLETDGIGPWLLEASLASSGRRELPFRDLVGATFLYPLDLKLSVRDLDHCARLELCRQGLDEDVVLLRGAN